MTRRTARAATTVAVSAALSAALLLPQLFPGTAFGHASSERACLSITFSNLSVRQESDLEDFPRLDIRDLDERFQDWFDEVSMIMTDNEADVFLRLGTDLQRDQFIEHFWSQRDPTPGTPSNEYRDKHYERLAYANRHFGKNTPGPGWRTDQGRIYVILGAPMSRRELTSTRMAYPVEVWNYHADPKLRIRPFFNG
jgi:GWxTD domain-containing protein